MKASILLPVYNAAHTIQDALDSIFNQTFTDFNVVIINDGSTDKSEDIIKSYTDKRILYYSNENNKGLIYTLNRGLDLCKGEYIIRMDADDIMMPTRIEKQVFYMDNHPQIVASGTSIICFDNIHRNKLYTPPLSPEEINYKILLGSPLLHPTSIIRKKIIDHYNIKFNENYKHAEDYKFWYDLLQYGELANLKEPLLKYRLSPTQISSRHQNEQLIVSLKVRKEIITNTLQKQGISYPNSFSISTIQKIKKTFPSNSLYSTILFLFLMSLSDYNIKTLIWFIYSKLYIQKGFSYKYTAALFLKILNPNKLQKFNLNLLNFQ